MHVLTDMLFANVYLTHDIFDIFELAYNHKQDGRI